MVQFLDFEKPLLDLQAKVEELRAAEASGADIAEKDIAGEIDRLEIRMARVARLLYRDLSPVQIMQVARHPERPQGADYVKALVEGFVPLAGDRRYGDDQAMLAGVGKWLGQTPCVVCAIDKGKTTAERIARNFGMPKPEGYRKAQRLMRMADRLGLPIVTLVDTPGAYPGVDAEERGQGQAIAESLDVLMQVKVPVVSVITGEGGSGGALALAAADRVLMLEHGIYSVISPEGCAAILWKEANKDTIHAAATALKLTAKDLLEHKVIDGIIDEPVGGAQRDAALAMKRVGKAVAAQLAEVAKANGGAEARRGRFLGIL
ncbi:MAG: acetyl-CoA carboxylase carboxyltransferase subunit alpha [Pseudomonadaceae bacterium]|nr:acetyl-CoA carboxylase carboxyltransferase subunit alpha [Pseudomonadaceae bacterium]